MDTKHKLDIIWASLLVIYIGINHYLLENNKAIYFNNILRRIRKIAIYIALMALVGTITHFYTR